MTERSVSKSQSAQRLQTALYYARKRRLARLAKQQEEQAAQSGG